MAVLLGGPASLPHPRQGCGSHQPLPAAAISHSGQQLQGGAPGSVTPLSCLFPPSSSARTHRNHVCLTIYKTPPVGVVQWELGSVQLGPGPHTGLSLEPWSARELSVLAGAAVEFLLSRGNAGTVQVDPDINPRLVARADSGPWKVAGQHSCSSTDKGREAGESPVRRGVSAVLLGPQGPALPVHSCCPKHGKGTGRPSKGKTNRAHTFLA